MLSRGTAEYTKQTHRLIDNDNMLLHNFLIRFRLGNLASSLKNRVKKPWKVRLHIEVEPCVIFISFYFRSLHSSRRRRRHVFNKQQDATERTLRRRGCGTD